MTAEPRVIVNFQSHAAFVQELAERGPNVERVVRVCRSLLQDKLQGEHGPIMSPTWSVHVEAGYLRLVEGVLMVVQLREYVGQEWHAIDGVMKDARYGEVQMRAGEVLDAIATACAAADLEIADGSSYDVPA